MSVQGGADILDSLEGFDFPLCGLRCCALNYVMFSFEGWAVRALWLAQQVVFVDSFICW